MTEGVPGKDPQPGVLGSERDTAKDLLVALVTALARPVAYLLIPPLLLYRGRPITERLWQWRKVYLGFFAGTVALSAPQILNGNFAGLLIAPVFHLFVIAVVAQVILIAVPGMSVPTSATPPTYVLTVGMVAAVIGIALSFRSTWTWGAGDDDTDAVSLDTGADEYAIPMTEVWESGGKYE